ncbi:unnamed protein product [Peniophora sp. CBMAI 1063]|nr:unnamed protein product [Peniophora sp. CBMAI 1063]
MDVVGPPKKRQRTENDDVIVKPEPSNDIGPTATLLDYDDGNVVIRCYTRLSVAELSTYYREGRIATDSVEAAIQAIPAEGIYGTVFSNHFRGEETILTGHDERRDGDLVFEFTGYDTQDLEFCQDMDAFLAMIYSPDHLNERATKLSKLGVHQLLSRILRASKRYNSTSIRTICVGHLERLYPTRLSYWTSERFQEIPLAATTIAIRFATEHSIGSIAPILLYRLSTLFASFDGFEHPEHQEPLDKLLAPLTAQDLQSLLRGNATLISQTGLRLARLTTLPEPGSCQQRQGLNPMVSCSAVFARHVRPPFASPDAPPSAYYARNPLDRFDQIMCDVAKEALICVNCKSKLLQETKAAKAKLWKDLPRIYNVVNLTGEGWGSE